MKTVLIGPLTVLFLVSVSPCPGAQAGAANPSRGEQAFAQHCAICHPKGENIINPAKALHKKALSANGIGKPADIVDRIRDPGPGMTRFDEKTIPDETARAIAEYVLKTFQ